MAVIASATRRPTTGGLSGPVDGRVASRLASPSTADVPVIEIKTRGLRTLDEVGGFVTVTDQAARPRAAPIPAYQGQATEAISARLDADAGGRWPGQIPPVQLRFYTVQGGLLLMGEGDDGVVLTADHRRVDRVSAFSRMGRQNLKFARARLPDGGEIGDAFVGFDAAFRNWYHWSVLALPRLALAAALPADVRIVVPAALEEAPRAWAQSLAELGLGERLLPLGPGLYRSRCLRLLWTASPQPTDIVYTDTLHATAPAGRGEATRRVIVRRAAKGRLTPEQEGALDGLARARGFETVVLEMLDFQAQREVFAQASVIVAAHGAGLANLMHANRSARVLELIHLLEGEPYLRPWYYQLATMRRLRYMMLDTGGVLTQARLEEAVDRLLAAP